MRYFSTRDNSISVTASEAIIQGISKDGGLFVPENIPSIDIDKLMDMDYKEIAYEVMAKFFTDFSKEALEFCIENAYDEKFDTQEIAPIKEVGDIYFLELFHGPTLAFKDMALSILPYLLKEALRINEIKEEVVILTATSGDTGKAALQGFANVKGTKIIVFYPEEGVSQIQKLQMNTQEGENTFVVGIRGNFDDAQNGVKEIFNNQDFIKLLGENNYRFSSANSINIGRLIPQTVYYFNSYIRLLREGKLKAGEKFNIVVPTGNFGNILAAYYSKMMGLPVNKLVCASNENSVLTDFFKTGKYDKRRDLALTSSPSMDILISSNLERLIHHLGYGQDRINENMDSLDKEGYYKVNKEDFNDFYADYASDGEVGFSIKEMFDTNKYLMDTHTGVGHRVNEKYRQASGDETKSLIASTASPFKFARAVGQALGIETANKDEFKIIDELSLRGALEIPKSLSELKTKKIVHKNVCDKEEMGLMVEKFLRVGEYID